MVPGIPLKPGLTVPYTLTLGATSVPLFMWGSPLTLAYTSRLGQVLTPPGMTDVLGSSSMCLIMNTPNFGGRSSLGWTKLYVGRWGWCGSGGRSP